MPTPAAPRWWGGRRHKAFTFLVFIAIATLDNSAAAIMKPLFRQISGELGVELRTVGYLGALHFLVYTFTAMLWGYRGDQGDRKRLLVAGTALWSAGMAATGFTRTFAAFASMQIVAAIGIGCITSVGFSVVGDFIHPRRRGLALSLWTLAQGLGSGAGSFLAGTMGAEAGAWPVPFFAVACAGLLFGVLFPFTYSPGRGMAEPELAEVYARGSTYDHRIRPRDLVAIWGRRSNCWILLQAFLLALPYGTSQWLHTWAIAKIEAEGFGLDTATIAATALLGAFSLGGLAIVPIGLLSDVVNRRSPRGRPLLAAFGLIASLPCTVLAMFYPFSGLDLPTVAEGARPLEISLAAVLGIFTNVSLFVVILAGLGSVVLAAAYGATVGAMLTDVNLPEHRGTVFAVTRFATAVGASVGMASTGFVIELLTAWFDEPDNVSAGFVVFSALLVPAGLSLLAMARTFPADVEHVRRTLSQRAAASRLPDPPGNEFISVGPVGDPEPHGHPVEVVPVRSR